MGNRVYATIKNKNESKTIYAHWNGCLLTWAPLIDSAFQAKIRQPELILECLKSLDIKTELQTDPNAKNWTEENGHFFIDLDAQTFLVRKEVPSGIPGLYDSNTEVLGDLKQAFESHLLKNIKVEYHSDSRKEYWDGIRSKSLEFFGAKKPVVESEIEAFIKESPYGLTPKEKTLIKRKIKTLETPDFKIKVSLSGNVHRFSIIFLNSAYIDRDETIFNADRNHSNKDHAPIVVLKSVYEKIETKIRDIVNPHQVTYSERDSMSDYAGSYRMEYVWINYEFVDEIKETARKEIFK